MAPPAVQGIAAMGGNKLDLGTAMNYYFQKDSLRFNK
jgi:hypothetical protein